MIEVKLYISDRENSDEGALLNHPTARVSAPYSLLGEFLTTELDRPHAWLYENLPKLRKRIECGQLPKYDGGGEGHYLQISVEAVVIETIYDDPPRSCTVPANEFWDVLNKWFQFIETQ